MTACAHKNSIRIDKQRGEYSCGCIACEACNKPFDDLTEVATCESCDEHFQKYNEYPRYCKYCNTQLVRIPGILICGVTSEWKPGSWGCLNLCGVKNAS